MFSALAPDYDRLNTLLTFGMVRSWRRALIRAAGVEAGDRVVDVCTGTGRVLVELEPVVGPRGIAVGVDFTLDMLRRAPGRRVLGDALRLPFPSDAFDAAVSAFALRDVADQHRHLEEMVRVTRRGGRIAVLEVGRPEAALTRLGFDLWFREAVPRVAGLLGQREPHRFLVRSLAYLPDPGTLREMMRAAGADDVRWRDLSLGAARLFWATVPTR